MLNLYYEAPNYWDPRPRDTAVFLAGGITGCPDWQTYARERLMAAGVTVLNPRRADFDVSDPNAGAEQVAWEQHHLMLPEVVTMFWFAATDPTVTVQPIALLELGQALAQQAAGLGRRYLVGADKGYPREQDVLIFSALYRGELPVYSHLDELIDATIRATERGN